MKKGFITMLSAVCMLILLMPMCVGAAEELTYGNFIYEINKDGTGVKITDYEIEENEESVLNVPAEINGLPVTEVDKLAFAYCGMTTVNYNAKTVCGFYNCSNLKTINFSENVETIESSAFVYCSALESVTIPDNIHTINSSAFTCDNLKTVTIGTGIKNIGESAFTYTGITTLNYNSEIVSGFSYTSVKTVYLGDNVKEIGESAFANSELENINIPKNVHTIGEDAFGFSALKNITIPDNVHTIGLGAFCGCDMDTLTIGKGIVNIDSLGVSSLNTLNYNSKIVYNILSHQNVKNIIFGDNVKEIADGAFWGCTALENITFSDSVESIGEYAFNSCTALKKVTLGKNIKRIDERAFTGCKNLSEITVPDDLQYLGYMAFYNTAFWNNAENWDGNSLYLGSCLVAVKLDKAMDTYTVKGGVTLIGDGLFDYAYEEGEEEKYLTVNNIKIPASVKYISGRIFYLVTNIILDEKK